MIRSKDCTPIAVWHSGSGTPLVLVHGATVDHTAWASVQATLERHFSVWILDRRGHGHSGDAAAYAFEREAEDIATVIDTIGGRVHVLGHSFGGLCALEAALLSTNVDRLILYEPPLRVGRSDWSAAFDARMQALLEKGEKEEALLLFLRERVKLPPHEISAVQALPTWAMRVAAAHTIPRELRSADQYAFNARRFRCLQTPTLLLVGGKSPARWHAIAKTLHAALPNSQIAELPGQGHLAIRMAPDLFTHEVIRFLMPL